MAVVRHIKTNDLYMYLGDNIFRNMRTQKQGFIDNEAAQTALRIDLEATHICINYPIVEELIHRLNLKSDK